MIPKQYYSNVLRTLNRSFVMPDISRIYKKANSTNHLSRTEIIIL